MGVEVDCFQDMKAAEAAVTYSRRDIARELNWILVKSKL